MTSNFKKMQAKGAALIAGALLLGHAAFGDSASAQNRDGQFSWSAELVSFDASNRTVTLKSRLDVHADVEILDELSEGDEITLTWTGISWGAGISGVSRGAASEASERLTMPAEFVRTEMDGDYIVYRLPVPQASVGELRELEAGAWVTGTSARNAEDLDGAVNALRPYNAVS